MSLPIRGHGMGCALAGVLEVGYVGVTESTLTVCTTCWRCIRVMAARDGGWLPASALDDVQGQLLGRDWAELLGGLGLVADDAPAVGEGLNGRDRVERIEDQGAVRGQEARKLPDAA